MELKDLRLKINSIDKTMAELFVERMEIVKQVAEYKAKNNLPIEDCEREAKLLESNLKHIKNDELKEYYKKFLKDLMNISKEYQKELTRK